MELMTISEVSRRFNVSTRALRYYEQIGLLHSIKKADYAYRTYDDAAVRRLQQIIILRKLRIPLKQISAIYQDDTQAKMMEVFEQRVEELNSEIGSLETIRTISQALLTHLRGRRAEAPGSNTLEDAEVMEALALLNLSDKQSKEEQMMQDLNTANKMLSKLNDVRVVHLPPCTVAACHHIGKDPEDATGGMLEQFVKENNLYKKKPDARVFGFNHPNPCAGRPHHGYESWVTIPEDMDVTAPLTKKQFQGGLYAAHKIMLGDFHEWGWLKEWVARSDKYEANYSKEGEEIMSGCLEEGINWVYYSHLSWPENHEPQLDLLLPVKLK